MMLGVGVKEDELQSILNYLSTGKTNDIIFHLTCSQKVLDIFLG